MNPSDEKQDLDALMATMGDTFDRLNEPEEEVEEQPRDEKGKYANKPEKAEEETEEEVEEAVEAEEAPEEPDIPAPATWTAETKEAFKALPRDIQKMVSEQERSRDRHFHQRNQEFASAKQLSEQFEQVVGPYKQMIEAEGGTPLGAVQSLLQTAVQLRRDPQGTITQLAQQFGVNLGGDANQNQLYLQAMQRVNALENHIRQQELSQRKQQDQQVTDEITRFQSEADANGTPLRPHFDAVREDMAALLHAERAKTLQDAYEMAVWARPDIRTSLLQAQQAQAAAKQQQTAAKAKKAAGVRVKGAEGLPEREAPRSLDETLEAAYQRATSA